MSPLRWNTIVSARAAGGAISAAAAATAIIRTITGDATGSLPARGRQDDQLEAGVEPDRRRVDHQVVEVGVAHVGVVEVAGGGPGRPGGRGLLPRGRLPRAAPPPA